MVIGQFHTPGRVVFWEITASTHWIGGWKDPRAALDAVEKSKFLAPAWNLTRSLSRPVRSLVSILTELPIWPSALVIIYQYGHAGPRSRVSYSLTVPAVCFHNRLRFLRNATVELRVISSGVSERQLRPEADPVSRPATQFSAWGEFPVWRKHWSVVVIVATIILPTVVKLYFPLPHMPS
jgi:hypothetical protein